MSAYLYLNYKGDPVTVHSYSSGAKFDACPKDYELEKVQGYRRKDNKAALKFGIAVESGLQYFYANAQKSGSGVDEFKRLWLASKEDAALQFTDKENSWADLYKMGAEMLELFEIVRDRLPLNEPTFQLNYKREVFPGTELAGIEHTAFIDMVCRAPWSHPLLPRIMPPNGSEYQPMLVDIKTSAVGMGNAADMLSLDPQLREYAWTAGIELVGFLWFVKAKPGYFEKGSQVTFLQSRSIFEAGDKAVVLFVDKACASIGCIPPSQMYNFETAAKDVKGKALELLKKSYVEKYGGVVLQEAVTKVRIEFAAARTTAEDRTEAGDNVGRQIVEIVQANQTGKWPKRPGVRFPNNKCTFCNKRGLCLNKPELVEKLLVQIKPADPEPDDRWLEEFEAEE